MNKTFTFLLLIVYNLAVCQIVRNYSYDKVSNTSQAVSQDGTSVYYTYDELGNRLSKTISQPKTLAVNIFLEGLFNSNTHQLNKAQNSGGDAFEGQIADSISIELHQSDPPYARIGESYHAALLVSGQANFVLGSGTTGQFYLVVKHRNSIETWSSEPVSLTSGVNFYDFTASQASAYGQNLKLLDGYFCIICGDVNQDGIVNSLDIERINGKAMLFYRGLIEEDLNGDGIVDAMDFILCDNNAATGAQIKSPE